jgi:hypothetical protein
VLNDSRRLSSIPIFIHISANISFLALGAIDCLAVFLCDRIVARRLDPASVSDFAVHLVQIQVLCFVLRSAVVSFGQETNRPMGGLSNQEPALSSTNDGGEEVVSAQLTYAMRFRRFDAGAVFGFLSSSNISISGKRRPAGLTIGLVRLNKH